MPLTHRIDLQSIRPVRAYGWFSSICLTDELVVYTSSIMIRLHFVFIEVLGDMQVWIEGISDAALTQK